MTFGDPLQMQAFQNIDAANTKINCAQGDPVCNSQFIITAAHLSYTSNGDVPATVQFIQGKVQAGGAAGSTAASGEIAAVANVESTGSTKAPAASQKQGGGLFGGLFGGN